MTWNTLPFTLLKIAKWIRPLHVMARAIHCATSWGSIPTIRFWISKVDRFMTRTGTFLQMNQSFFQQEDEGQVHTGSTSALWSSKCALYLVSSTTYAHPLLRPGSASLLETFLCLSQKLASRARKSAYKYLSVYLSVLSADKWLLRKAYCRFSGSSSHPGDMFFPGWGQAGHSTAHSPSFVWLTPAGSCPLPERFVIFKCRHSCAIRINDIYLSYVVISFSKISDTRN